MLLFLMTTTMLYQAPSYDAMLTWRSGKMYAFSGAYY